MEVLLRYVTRFTDRQSSDKRNTATGITGNVGRIFHGVIGDDLLARCGACRCMYNDDSVSITTREPEVDAPAIDTATCPLDRVTVSRV